MLLALIAYLGGVLTIVSPCILPVLPFVFARADRPFVRTGLPLLAGMAVTFAAVASLAAVGGEWAARANDYGRIAAMALFAVFGLTLLFPAVAERLTRPIVALGGRLSEETAGKSSITSSFLLGIATGLLWAPCAGPILGLILTGAALQGASLQTSFYLLAYAAGAATSLALALLAGGRLFAIMKRGLGAGEWLRRGLGAAVLVGVVAIALGLDTGLLARISTAGTTTLEQAVLEQAGHAGPAPVTSGAPAPGAGAELPDEGPFPPLSGAVAWLNTEPLDAAALKGKVVLVDFWTYSCINCLRAMPYVKAWAEKYRDQGLIVIGVHSPEFAFEKNMDNVRRAVADLGLTYPVALDNDFAIWRAFDNKFWPAHYFIDAKGRIRFHHFGEGKYEESEGVIRRLLAEAGKTDIPSGPLSVEATGVQASPLLAQVRSPETYLGYNRAGNFATPDAAIYDESQTYETPASLDLNHWALSGAWTMQAENVVNDTADAALSFRFRARDLHLVIGPGSAGRPVRFRVLVDGKPAGADHGVDTDETGNGVVNEHRLYQLVRQKQVTADHTFQIEFLDPGAEVFAFTFG